jgi:hypothetical protein
MRDVVRYMGISLGLLLGVVVLVVVFVGIIPNWLHDATRPGPTQFDARAVCDDTVREQVASTSTFLSTARQQGNAWLVSGSVDAKNAYGQQVLTTYDCELTYSDGYWTLKHLSVSP